MWNCQTVQQWSCFMLDGFICNYSKRHNKFLFLALAGAIYGSSCEAENEISNVVYYKKV